MFNKIKQGKELLDLHSQAKKLQKELAEVVDTAEIDEVRVKVSADQKVIYIEKAGVREEKIEKAVNEAFKKVQKKAAQKMMEMGGGLGGLLGGLNK
jgi:DNA-binding protein YbaB